MVRGPICVQLLRIVHMRRARGVPGDVRAARFRVTDEEASPRDRAEQRAPREAGQPPAPGGSGRREMASENASIWS